VQVICLSRGTFVGGEELAVQLASKLGFTCLSREQLADAATEEGIPVGKLEMAIARQGSFSERLALEREHYLAYMTARLCDRAMNGGLVYHGRAGHLVMSGITHVLRVRVVTGEERRIRAAMQRLGIDRKRASHYLEEVDDDWRRWTQSLHGVSLEDTAQYDIAVNLDHLSVENAAAGLTAIAQLPDFQVTPASEKAVSDLRLAAHCRLALARDDRTYQSSFKVRADSGVVTVSYLPHDAGRAEAMVAVVSGVGGVRQVRCTMATTNILWVQESFDVSADSFRDVTEIATKWNAAVELVRLASEHENIAHDEERSAGVDPPPPENLPVGSDGYNGGVEDDVEEPAENGGVTPTIEELARLGRSGGGRVVAGGAQGLLASIDRSIPYSLVVLGEVFGDRGHAAKIRMKRELQSFLSDHIKAPVVAVEDLKQQYLFGRRDIFRAFFLLAAVVIVFFAVFSHQRWVLDFLLGDWWAESGLGRVIAAGAVALFVPMVAFLYGSFSRIVLKLIKIE
jgi:cytidylate kinase